MNTDIRKGRPPTCTYCENRNVLRRTSCPHCGEEFPAPPAPPPDDDDLGAPTAGWLEDREGWAVIAVIIGIAVTLVLVGGTVITYRKWPVSPAANAFPVPSSGPAAPSESPEQSAEPSASATDASGQANAVNTLLESIKASRGKLPGSLGDCGSVGSDLPVLQQVVQERQDEANQATGLAVDALQDGDTLKQALVDMAQNALTADQKYLDWAQQATPGNCTAAGQDADVTAADQAAADAKRSFVSLWNADAGSYGLPTYAWNDF